MQEKKIIVNKNDEVTSIVEQVLDAESDEIIIAIPRFSKFIESPANFRLLKREGEALDKRVLIESVDDQVIELAKNAGLECVNPFFDGGTKQFSDIVTVKKGHHTSHKEKASVKHTEHKKEETHHRIDADEPRASTHTKSHARRSSTAGMRRFLFPGVIAICVGILIFVLGWVLPRARITLVSAQTSWPYTGTLIVDTDISAIDISRTAIPGERFSEKKNIQLFFPASGKKQVAEKATGIITIYNAHSSEPQALVKSTRFVTPDGKIYRLTANITVPGAKIESGKIVPSSIDAQVTADKAGSTYNIGPTEKFSIPGFSGTAKAETFYGKSTGSIAGGFVGEVAYPSSADLAEAKITITETLRSSMRELMRTRLPKDFTVPEGGEVFKLLNTYVDSQASTEGKFALFAEGELSFLTFREADVVALFTERVRTEAGDASFLVKKYTSVYKKGSFDVNGKFSIPIEYQSSLVRAIDPGEVQAKIAGKKEQDLRTLIFSLPGLESAHISLWPFWVRTVPKDIEKIEIIIDPESTS